MIGQSVLHYKVLEKLGEGGMGVVYRAEDTTLHRTVALKFLPEKASGTEQEKARFLQEARAAAVLNHPNICTIHAIEQFEGRTFIVMEHVEGTTLREKTPFKMLSAAYDAAIQVGEALAEAHSKGIVHRDVKSENIMITPKGQIKVMDFGLAKLKGSLKLTRTSSTVGTLGYMSPEQIQGGEVDHRSDIFSLGVVLFEMVAGQLPFRGEHEAAIVYSIVNEEPRPVTDFLPGAPEALGEIFAKAFEKDPGERYQSAADLAVDLKRLKKQSSTHSRSRVAARPGGEARPGSSSTSAETMARIGGTGSRGSSADTGAGDGASRGSRLPLIATAILLIAALAYILYTRGPAPAPAGPAVMTFERLTEQAGAETWPDISPDGNYIVYVKPSEEYSDIYLQRIGGGNPINLTAGSGTTNTQPEFSPKGDLIAFQSGRDSGGIFVMGSTGESVRRVTSFGYNPSWAPDGKTIFFQTEYLEHPYSRGSVSQVWKVELDAGKTAKLYAGDGVQPRVSPDGKTLLFWGLPLGTGKRELWTMPADGGTPTRLTDDDAIDWNPVWAPDGKGIHFLSTRGGTMNLWRLGYDAATGTVTGSPEPEMLPTQNCTGLRISRDGKKIIYLSTERRSNIFRAPFDPASLRLTGAAVPVTEGSRDFGYLSLSPDGKLLAFTIGGTGGIQEDIGVMGIDGKNFRKLTNDRFKDRGPKWSHDGKRIAFYSERSGTYQIWSVNVDGSGIEQVTDEKNTDLLSLPNWTPDDQSIFYQTPTGGATVELSGELGRRKTKRVRPTEGGAYFSGNSLSADGSSVLGSLITQEGVAGPLMIYAFADSSYRKLATEGIGPLWCADGKTIVFTGNDRRLRKFDTRSGTIVPVDGLPRFSDNSEYALSPDNRWIYFVRIETETDAWGATVQGE